MAVKDRLSYNTPTLEVPQNPRQIQIGSRTLYEYASPAQVLPLLRAFSEVFRINDYDVAIVNVRGGIWLAAALARLQEWPGEFVPIRYNRPKSGIGVNRVNPVPAEYRGVRALIVEDVLDRGDTAYAMWEDCPGATFLFAVQKLDVPNQVYVPRSHVMVRTRNVWLGSLGMDLDGEGEEDAIRSHNGIVFKP